MRRTQQLWFGLVHNGHEYVHTYQLLGSGNEISTLKDLDLEAGELEGKWKPHFLV
ncbi:hypothetical protein GBAR_LOCUS24617 [Geodia barretti]|uniref:Uncharacterized protein n=1 Tax=Geodia barretti TaxID=519541 RepID=A0AA35T9T9_GEOBA|nr:hypothetical protein GBAR_LOCUS24617 [Geodia barretti]